MKGSFAFLCLFGLVVHISVAQLINGNFENNNCGSFNPPWCTYFGGNFVPGWSITGGDVDIHRSQADSGSLLSGEGTYFVDLNGNDAGAIAQTFPTSVGSRYELSFIMSGNMNCPPTIKSMLLSVTGNPSQQYDIDITGRTPAAPNWVLRTYNFIATSASSTLNMQTLVSGSCGPTVDNFILTRLCNSSDSATYHTQSEGDWGDKCSEGFQTGCYRDQQFATCFPNGLQVGCECVKKNPFACFKLHFSSSAAVENYLPQLGSPAPLDRVYFDPSQPPPISTSSGNFGGQLTALALSLGFEQCDPQFHTACGSLRDLYVCDNRCERCKKNNSCKRNVATHCEFVRENDEDDGYAELEYRNNNNNNNGKPQYANCEAFYGMTVNDIFRAASDVLGGCANCLSKRNIEGRNNQCVRNSGCKKNPERNNKNCSRNNNCKKNKNCCCCVEQSNTPLCDSSILNACITMINQAFIFGKSIKDVDSGTLFQTTPCPGTGAS